MRRRLRTASVCTVWLLTIVTCFVSNCRTGMSSFWSCFHPMVLVSAEKASISTFVCITPLPDRSVQLRHVGRCDSLYRRNSADHFVLEENLPSHHFITGNCFRAKSCITARMERRRRSPRTGYRASSFQFYATAADQEQRQRPRLDKSTVEFNQVLDTIAKMSRDVRGSAERAEGMLQDALRKYLSAADPNNHNGPKPDKISFASVMDAWAKSGEVDGPRRAEELLNTLETLYRDSGTGDANNEDNDRDDCLRPNAVCYAAVIDAWAKSVGSGRLKGAAARSTGVKAARRAEATLLRMKELYDTGDNVDARPNTVAYSSVLDAWARTGAKNAARRAEAILQLMQSEEENGNTDVRVDALCFTSVLNAWANSGEGGAALRAEAILKRMSDLHEAGSFQLRPNVIHFNAVINAWAKSRQKGAAQRAEAILMQMRTGLEGDGGFDVVRPDTVSYATVLNAWAKSGESGAAERAEYILLEMIRAYDAGENADARPNTVCFSSVIDAWSRSRDGKAGERAEAILMEMQRLYEEGDANVRPNTVAANAVINAYSRRGGRVAAEKAASILQWMKDKYAAGESSLKLDTITYNAVIHAFVKSGMGGQAARMADALLQEMHDASNMGDSDVRPDTISYSSAINAWAKSDEPGKARRSYELLSQMDELDKRVAPNIYSYNAVMNACASTNSRSREEKLEALRILKQTFVQMDKSLVCEPNNVSFGLFLKACANLMPEGEQRDQIVHVVFRRCAEAGCVDSFVLRNLRRASKTVFKERFGSLAPDEELDQETLPVEWKRNVQVMNGVRLQGQSRRNAVRRKRSNTGNSSQKR